MDDWPSGGGAVNPALVGGNSNFEEATLPTLGISPIGRRIARATLNLQAIRDGLARTDIDEVVPGAGLITKSYAEDENRPYVLFRESVSPAPEPVPVIF